MVRNAALSRVCSGSAQWGAALLIAMALVPAAQSQTPSPQVHAQPWRPNAAAAQITVRSGDTLDRLIAQHFSGAPFSVVFMREVLARMNPQALPQGARGALLAGAVMRLPDGCQLRQMAFGEPADCAPAASPGSAPSPSAQERAEIERRSWVRYP